VALDPVRLEKIIWIGLPVLAWFALQGFTALARGAIWTAAAHGVMVGLIVAMYLGTRGRVLSGRLAIAYLVVVGVGILGWVGGPSTAVQVVGFGVVVVAQVAAIVTARRAGVVAPPLHDDAVVKLEI
jgi:hypothetical protein